MLQIGLPKLYTIRHNTCLALQKFFGHRGNETDYYPGLVQDAGNSHWKYLSRNEAYVDLDPSWIEPRGDHESYKNISPTWLLQYVPDTALDRRSREAMRNLSKIQYLNTGLSIRIQWRTTWWGRNTDDLGGTGYKLFKHCPFHNCLMIPAKKDLSAVDAYIFHYSPWRNGDVFNMPRHRSPEQKCIFFTKESESRCTIPYSSLFNLTMSHRLDSDIPQPYGVIRRKLSSDSIPHIGTNFAVGKTGLVAWVASNCHTTSRREVTLPDYKNI